KGQEGRRLCIIKPVHTTHQFIFGFSCRLPSTRLVLACAITTIATTTATAAVIAASIVSDRLFLSRSVGLSGGTRFSGRFRKRLGHLLLLQHKPHTHTHTHIRTRDYDEATHL